MGYLVRLDLHVVHDEDLRVRGAHQHRRRAPKLVQRGQLRSSIHIAVLQDLSARKFIKVKQY